MATDYRTRVRRLMETAQSFTDKGNEALALTYAEKAAALATKHGVEDALNEAFDEVKLNLIRKVVTMGSPYPKHRISLLGTIARTFGCRALKVGRNVAEVYGDERDIERVMFIYRVLSIHMLDGVAKARPELPERDGDKHWYFKSEGLTPAETKSFRVAWIVGYVQVIGERMKEAYTQTVAESTHTGAALVLADRRSMVDNFISEMGIKVVSGGKIKVNAAGYTAGREAGAKADLGQTRVDPRRLALGA